MCTFGCLFVSVSLQVPTLLALSHLSFFPVSHLPSLACVNNAKISPICFCTSFLDMFPFSFFLSSSSKRALVLHRFDMVKAYFETIRMFSKLSCQQLVGRWLPSLRVSFVDFLVVLRRLKLVLLLPEQQQDA